MPAELNAYVAAKGYVQSLVLMVTNPHRISDPNDVSYVLPFHMLAGFAVELYLKSVLIKSNHADTELRSAPVRHNLKKLLELAEADGFVSSGATTLVPYLSSQHASFEYRYMKADSNYTVHSLPSILKAFSDLDNTADAFVGARASMGLPASSDEWVLPANIPDWQFPDMAPVSISPEKP